jgi:hypothetical protein
MEGAAEPAIVVQDPWQNTILLQVGPAPHTRAAMALTAAVHEGLGLL